MLFREAAQDDGWDEEVGIVVGKITHYLEKCNVVIKKGELDEDGNDENGVYWGNAEYDEMNDYRLVQVEKRDQPFETGLTKREYFAAMALQGLLARNSGEEEMDVGTLGYQVYYAVRAADLLLSMLEEMK